METDKVEVVAGRTPASTSNALDDPAPLIDFVIDAAGGGWSRLAAGVTPDAFGLLFAATLRVDLPYSLT